MYYKLSRMEPVENISASERWGESLIFLPLQKAPQLCSAAWQQALELHLS